MCPKPGANIQSDCCHHLPQPHLSITLLHRQGQSTCGNTGSWLCRGLWRWQPFSGQLLTGIELPWYCQHRKKVKDTSQKKEGSQLPPVKSTDTPAPPTAGISAGKEGMETNSPQSMSRWTEEAKAGGLNIPISMGYGYIPHSLEENSVFPPHPRERIARPITS